MPPRPRLLILAVPLCLMLGLALPKAQTSPLPEGTITLKGPVVETFGGAFVVETERGRILVEAKGFEGGVSQGDVLQVDGRLRQRILDAVSIRRDDTVLFRTPGPDKSAGPSPAGIPETLARLGLTQLAPPERKKRHMEIATRDAAGRNIVASFDLSGRILELEDADHDKKRAPVRLTGEADAVAVVKQAGLAPTGRVERKKHHFEIEATSASGELIEVQVDMSGYIFKKIWLN